MPSVPGTGIGAASTCATNGVATDGAGGVAVGAIEAEAALVPTGVVSGAAEQPAVSNSEATAPAPSKERIC